MTRVKLFRSVLLHFLTVHFSLFLGSKNVAGGFFQQAHGKTVASRKTRQDRDAMIGPILE